MDVKDVEQSEIITKIQKILRLADSTRNNSIGEVESALETAHKLLRKHGLEMADVLTEEEATNQSSSVDIGEITGAEFKCTKVPKWMAILISCVNKITETKTIVQNFVPYGKNYGTVKIIFVGTQNDIETANELFHYLRNTVTKLSSHYQKESNGKFQQWRSFAEGCSCKLLNRSLELTTKKTWKPDEPPPNKLKIDEFEVDDDELDEDIEEEDDVKNECDISHFEEESEDDIDEGDEEESEDDIDEEDEEETFSEETHHKFAIIQAGKYKALDDYIKQKKIEQEKLSTSANLDPQSFELGSYAANSIDLNTKKMIKGKKDK